MTDLVLRGGLLVDGTGAPARPADVAITGGRISAVGSVGSVGSVGEAVRTIDVSGRVVAPGFVDLHSHSDVTLLSNPAAPSKVQQGVTTEVVGNCGLGTFPFAGDAGELRNAVSFLDRDPAVAWSWTDFDGYVAALTAAGPAVNVATLVAHVPLRLSSGGDLVRLRGLLAEALAAGAAGASTGLAYAPLHDVGEDELAAIGETVAAADKLFAWHLRDYADELLPSVEQAVRVAELTGCRTQISHLVAVGRRNWGKVKLALDRIDEARGRGIDVGVDVYPYLAGSTVLAQLLPDLDDHPLEWTDITLATGVPDSLVGRTIADLDGDGADVVRALVAAHPTATMIAGGRSEDDLLAVLHHPAAVVGSDGFALDAAGPTGEGLTHPRSYGCYPRLLTDYVGAGRLTLEQAVAKCTSLPAKRIGLLDRGMVAEGYAADVVVLDRERLADRSTYVTPHAYPEGVEVVIVNGSVVVHNEAHASTPAGVVLRLKEDRRQSWHE